MEFFPQLKDTTEPFFKNEAVARVKGRFLSELESIKILQAHGIQFSEKKGRARKESPLAYLRSGMAVPPNLKNVVLSRKVQIGNKLWGRVDFLVNHCGYTLLDERS
ncbi:MAG: hypothetical protein GY810_07600 [Aureispira sp.]|nr:hypothetical protein [Aureispira sp.]